MYDPTTQLNTRYISAYGNIVMLENKESLQIAHQLKAAVQKPNHKPLTVTKWSNQKFLKCFLKKAKMNLLKPAVIKAYKEMRKERALQRLQVS